MLANK